jgi:hypothetical protein
MIVEQKKATLNFTELGLALRVRFERKKKRKKGKEREDQGSRE